MGDTSFLNITLLSAQGLKDVCTFGTMSPYAKAWIDPSMKQRTPVAPNAGCTPVWGHKLSLPLPANALKDMNVRLSIQVMNQGTTTDTIVGSATIPLGDLIQTTTPDGLEFMAVQLQRPSGRVQGLVNFSVEIADQTRKYWEPSTSSSSKESGNPRDKFSRVIVNPPAFTVAKMGPSEDKLSVPITRGRLSGGKEPLAAPDALGSGHFADSRHESVWKPQQSMDPSVGKNERAPDPLGPSKRSNSIGSLAFSPLVTPPIAASKGTAGSVAPDALDRSKPRQGFKQQGGFANSVDSPDCISRDRGTEAHFVNYDNNPAQPSFAHTMFGGVLGALLMGDAVSDSKSSIEHVGENGQDDPGGNPSGLPQC